ncbi:flavodoxin-dependent (E)-4-hydroxy-3-methylbut-2-enyl-diphosphate synthase [bacterium]|jgi:(E)-4-hydroxy-3-methylbut-2-enyl-diphosphate synthase|nr:flavodoxin-dependent (E)-4-hydroxy-3-methylbut-2-enyl-diphosphate synthase [bacterium]
MKRRKTIKIKVGNVFVGGNAPISVQSMTKTDTKDTDATLRQISRLINEGCEIVRVAVKNSTDIKPFEKIAGRAKIPVIADIHFDYRLAAKAAEAGASCVRINPGNIGSSEKVKFVVDCLKKHRVPMRIGVNSGSLEPELLKKYKKPVPEALVESALKNIRLVEKFGFYDLKVSIKSTSVRDTCDAYRLLASKTKYPFHIGITEAGTVFSGTIKSAIGIGSLLLEGIGDTVRVSLTADPVREVRVAKEILKSLGLRKFGPEIISCPTCGRKEIDVEKIALEVEKLAAGIKTPMTIAVMGCSVNGPGEAREADIGIAGGKNIGIIFKNGRIIKKVKSEKLLSEFRKIIEKSY